MMDGVNDPLRRNSLLVALPVILLAVTLVACTATQTPGASMSGTPGFLLGLWHGVIAPITFIVSLFTDAVRVYAVPNLGRWYDFGFMLGIGGFSGGLFAGSRRRTR
jgi:hypothetical protein